MKGFLRRPLVGLTAAGLVAVVAGAVWVLSRRAPVVLLYHEVGPAPTHVLGITAEALDRHFAWLRDHGYEVVELSRVVDALETGDAVPSHWVALTFDDTLRSTVAHAVPLLRARGLPATFFLCSGDMGHDGRLGWDDVRALERAGISVGGHSRTHPWLPDLPDAELAEEIGGDRRALEGEGARAEFFAYPYGAVDERAARAAREAGYRAAFAVTPGGGTGAPARFALRRVAIGPIAAHPLVFRVAVSGYWPALKEGVCAVLGVASPGRPGTGVGWGSWVRVGGLVGAGLLGTAWALRRRRGGCAGTVGFNDSTIQKFNV